MRLKLSPLLVTIVSATAQLAADVQSRIERVEKGLAEHLAHYKIPGALAQEILHRVEAEYHWLVKTKPD